MRVNVGKTDRIARFLMGAALLVVGLVLLEGTARGVASVAGVLLLLTGGSGYCPLYGACGRGTVPPQVRENPRS